MDTFSRSDGMVVLYKQVDKQWSRIGITEVINDLLHSLCRVDSEAHVFGHVELASGPCQIGTLVGVCSEPDTCRCTLGAICASGQTSAKSQIT